MRQKLVEEFRAQAAKMPRNAEGRKNYVHFAGLLQRAERFQTRQAERRAKLQRDDDLFNELFKRLVDAFTTLDVEAARSAGAAFRQFLDEYEQRGDASSASTD